MPFGLNPVLTSKLRAAVAHACRALGARTITGPRCELASQFGSARSTGVNDQTAIVALLGGSSVDGTWRIARRFSLIEIKANAIDRGDCCSRRRHSPAARSIGRGGWRGQQT